MSWHEDFEMTYGRNVFSETCETQMELDEKKQWKRNYERNRDKYPCWRTKDGTEIKVADLTDSHIESLLNWLPKKDPNNETKWLDVIKAEKRYRNIDSEIAELEKDNAYYHKVIDTVY